MKQTISAAYQYALGWRGQGNAATFIPELTKEDPNQLGICVTTCGGEQVSVGDCRVQFTIQSVSKLILLAVALEDAGFEAVFSKVGMEPSGDQFNSIYRLELVNPHPLNPMINAGAIAVSSCITGQSVDDRFQKVRRMAARCLGVASVACSEEVFCCETKTGHRNQALAQMMKDKGVMDGVPEEHLAVYYHACSMLADCHMLSYFGAVLANGGRTPQAEQEILPPQTARLLRVLMASCGLYNRAGEFAFQVGIPAKSGSAGGIMAAVPGRMGIATFSPLLDEKGNSICGIKALEYLSQKMELSVY